jgi:hypothetical protein
MSQNASDLLGLLKDRAGRAPCPYIENELRRLALNLIAAGVTDLREGC